MTKFYIYASEVVYYMKEVEADSLDQVNEMIHQNEIDFGKNDITDGGDFVVTEIEENKNA